MFSAARLVKAGYVLGLSIAVFLLLWPNESNGQFRGSMPGPQLRIRPALPPINGMMGGGMMMGGMGGGMMGMGGGGMGMGGGGGQMGGGGMMGMGGGGMGGGMGGAMMGMGGGGGQMGQPSDGVSAPPGTGSERPGGKRLASSPGNGQAALPPEQPWTACPGEASGETSP